MDLYEREDLKEFLVLLFKGKAQKWTMNEKLFNLTYKLVSESSACSNAMSYVPRPVPYGREPFRY